MNGQVSPAPTPLQIQISDARAAGQRMVVLEVRTPVGVACYFLTGEGAERVGAGLAAAGRAARLELVEGLVVPDPGPRGAA